MPGTTPSLRDAVHLAEQGCQLEQVQRITGYASTHVRSHLPASGAIPARSAGAGVRAGGPAAGEHAVQGGGELEQGWRRAASDTQPHRDLLS